MTLNRLNFAKLCHYTLYGITFISLFVLCYFLYMDEAIEKSKEGATTLIRRSEERKLEIPTLTVCPKPGFKPSVSQKYNLSHPARFLFLSEAKRDIFGTQKTLQGVQNKKFVQLIYYKIVIALTDLHTLQERAH